MNTNPTDQATLERQVRQLLTTAKKEETLAYDDPVGGQKRLERADSLRREAEVKGRDLADAVMDQLLKEFSSGNVTR